jgi:uncharacterized protein (TIGR02271 family)
MSLNDNTSGATLTAFFEDRDDADDAVERLLEAGLPESAVRLVPGHESDTQPTESEHKGFFEALGDFFFPDEDRYAYAEGLRRGGFLITVSGVTAAQHDIVLEILDDEGAIDLDERQEAWRTEGWSGYEASTQASRGTGAARGTHRAAAADEDVIPVIEEELRVGKRDVNLGRVRVRSYVREEPVSETVSLRDDRVEVERRPVDRALGSDEAGFKDRVIEAEEHTEQAVVSKEARVTEEIVLRKTSEQHDETISDSVRKTEVEVEDDRDLANTSRKART